MIDVKEIEPGKFEITWDENDPQESMFNTWTSEDFQKVITRYIESLVEE